MSRMSSPIDRLKVRIGFTPANMRKRCAECEHLKSAQYGFFNLTCGKHGLMTTGFSICKDFSQRAGTTAVKDPC